MKNQRFKKFLKAAVKKKTHYIQGNDTNDVSLLTKYNEGWRQWSNFSRAQRKILSTQNFILSSKIFFQNQGELKRHSGIF